jgi:hypothetical protein
MKAFVSWIPRWNAYTVCALNGPDAGIVALRAKRVLMHDAEFTCNFSHPRYSGMPSCGVIGYIDVADVVIQCLDISVTAEDPTVPATWHSIVDVEHIGPMIRDGGHVVFNEDKNRYFRFRGLEYAQIDRADKVYLSPSMILAVNDGEIS